LLPNHERKKNGFDDIEENKTTKNNKDQLLVTDITGYFFRPLIKKFCSDAFGSMITATNGMIRPRPTDSNNTPITR
jgi:hypothetical protein